MIALDRPMPKNCDDCPCEHDAACYAEGVRNPNLYDYKGRPEQCPLIDLPEYEGKAQLSQKDTTF